MANSYATVPNVLPGNVTIGGNLTVSGDQLRIGAAAPFVRLGKTATPEMLLSFNLGFDDLTRDTGAFAGNRIRTDGTRANWFLRHVLAGGTNDTLVGEVWAADGTSVGNTGNTVENTVKSKFLPGGSLGAHGVLVLDTIFSANAQGGVATTFRVRFGGVVAASFTRAVISAIEFRVLLLNNGATGNQEAYMVVTDSLASFAGAAAALVVDTTVGQNLTVTIQNGAAADNWVCIGWRVHGFSGSLLAV